MLLTMRGTVTASDRSGEWIDRQGRDGDESHSSSHRFVLLHRPPDDPRSRPQGHHACVSPPLVSSLSQLTEGAVDLLVNFSRESVQNRLVASLYKESLFEDLLYEDEGLTAERERVKTLLGAYKSAFNTLSEVL